MSTLYLVGAWLGCTVLNPVHAQDALQGWEPRPRLVGTVYLRIGEVLGKEEYTFGTIAGFALDSADRIYVADGEASSIRVYDGAGKYRYEFGRSGQGPGEFRDPFMSPCGPRLVDGDRLWLVSPPYWLEVFEIESDGARHVRSLRSPERGVLPCDKPMVRRDGQIAITVFGSNSYGHGTRVHMDSLGNEISRFELPEALTPETLGWARTSVPDPNDPGDIEWSMPSPFSPRDLIAHAPDGGFARTVTSSYHVEIFDASGSEIAAIDRDRPGPPLTNEDEEHARRRLDTLRSSASRLDGTFDGYEIADRKPAIRNIWFDELGRLWVEVWPTVDRVGRRVAHVYTASAEPLFTADWPEGIDLSHGEIHGCVAVGAEELEYETSGVVRLRFAADDADVRGPSACSHEE